jgi:two-component system, chemotaxis family, protein-glutamate methylesterase/glutaminase
MERKIRVLVVDDAMFMRKAITDILASDPHLEVIDTARNGLDGLEKIKQLRPDVVTLDIDMPIMDGLTSIRHIMIQAPIPIVVLSSLFNDGAITFDALRLGVVDFVPKPSGAISTDIDTAKQMIIDRIKMAASVHLENIRRVKLQPGYFDKDDSQPEATHPLDYLIAVGTNISGPNTVIRLMSQIPVTLPASVIVVQEISPKILPSFVRQFDRHTPWRVQAAEHGAPLEPGVCYIHSNEKSLKIASDSEGRPTLEIDERISNPLNLFFSSAADTFGGRTIGVMLTGTGSDGATGFSRIREKAGTTIAQDKQCCVYPNLTENVVAQNLVDMVIDEVKLPGTIQTICTGAAASC